MSKKATFWVILVSGLVVVTVAAFAIGQMIKMSSTKATSETATTATVQIGDGADAASEQERANRLTLGNAGSPDDESAREDADREKRDEEDADREKNKKAAEEEKVKIDGEDSTSSSEKVIVTTESTAPQTRPEDEDLLPADVSSPKTASQIYRLQLGKFASEENARKLAADVKASTGLDMFVGSENAGGKTLYRVQGGAFGKRENAESYARELELKGYKVFVSTENKKQ